MNTYNLVECYIFIKETIANILLDQFNIEPCFT